MIPQEKVDRLLRALDTFFEGQEFEYMFSGRQADMREVVQRWAAELVQPSHDRVELPQNEAQAELMAKAGMMWLEQNAPHKLAKQPPEPAIPDGWVIVPREPTIPMRCAGELTKAPISCWFAMVDAAPKPPEPKPAQCDIKGCTLPIGHAGFCNCLQSEPPPAKPELCPHGMPLAENICGPCSQGRPNRKPESAAAKPDEGQSRLRDYEAALRKLVAGPHHSLPNDEVAGWSMQVARDALSMPPSPQSSRLEFYAVVTEHPENSPPEEVPFVLCRSANLHALQKIAKEFDGDTFGWARVARVTVLEEK